MNFQPPDPVEPEDLLTCDRCGAACVNDVLNLFNAPAHTVWKDGLICGECKQELMYPHHSNE